MSKLRLVKVLVQPHFVLDDGESLTEQIAEPVEVKAADWPTYPGEGFADAVRELERALNEDASA